MVLIQDEEDEKKRWKKKKKKIVINDLKMPFAENYKILW